MTVSNGASAGGFDFEQTSGLVPLFPLPGVCLLPGEFLPLHVFEPRYRTLLEHALAGERLIAVPMLDPGFEATYYGNPPVAKVMGVGRIVADQRREDGTSDIVLCGVARVRLLQVVRQMPYRLARVAPLGDRIADPERVRTLADEARHLVASLCGGDVAEGVELFGADLAPGDLPGRLACVAQIEGDLKQRVLEVDEVGERLELICRVLRAFEQELRRTRIVESLAPAKRSLN